VSHVVVASAKRVVSVGEDLRARLEAVARAEGSDATYLGRRIVREYVEAAEQRADVARNDDA
jgi:hypothetical protein